VSRVAGVRRGGLGYLQWALGSGCPLPRGVEASDAAYMHVHPRACSLRKTSFALMLPPQISFGAPLKALVAIGVPKMTCWCQGHCVLLV